MELTRFTGFWVVLVVLAVQPAIAQEAGHLTRSRASSPSPYGGMEKRSIKALSDQQIADLRAGRGMGLALPAELNGYPGPTHVLELADALALSDEQRMQTRALLDAMKAETITIGERMIAEETALDRLFAEKRVTQASLNAATLKIGIAQGELRSAHLRYHLAMAALLSPAQIARYAELRGYAGNDNHHHGRQ